MAGRNHTTRTPHRLNAALKRDLFGYIARQTVGSQDLRKVLYVSPWGKGFHKVKNPVSDEEYVVSDGLGGATMAPGSVAMAASFSGQQGETIISRPPAGFGGAATTKTTLSPETRPAQASDTYAYLPLGFCWDESTSKAIIARRKITTDSDLNAVAWALEFVKLNLGSMPHQDAGRNKAFCSIELTSSQSSAIQVYAMQMGANASFYIFYAYESGAAPSTNSIRLAKIHSGTGEVETEIVYEGSDSASGIGTVYAGGYLYAIESQEGAASLTGPPFTSHQRLTKRHNSTLEIVSYYDIPNPGTYDGWTIRTSGCWGLVEDSGDLMAYLYYIKQPTGGSDTKMFSQAFTTALALSGSPTAFTDNNDAFLGAGNQVKSDLSGGIFFIAGGDLYTRTLAGGSPTIFLAGYDNDGGENAGIAPISAAEVLILGSGSAFTTSILKATGQELP